LDVKVTDWTDFSFAADSSNSSCPALICGMDHAITNANGTSISQLPSRDGDNRIVPDFPRRRIA